MSDYRPGTDWLRLRERAVEAFSASPRDTDERDIVEVFETQPHGVAALVDDVAEKVAKGQVKSGWSYLRSAAVKLASAAPVAPVVSHEKRVQQAEAWIRNAGCLLDSQHDVLDELFGEQPLYREGPDGELVEYGRTPPSGLLRGSAGDAVLVRRMLRLWVAERPRGVRCEEEFLERARRCAVSYWAARGVTVGEEVA